MAASYSTSTERGTRPTTSPAPPETRRGSPPLTAELEGRVVLDLDRARDQHDDLAGSHRDVERAAVERGGVADPAQVELDPPGRHVVGVVQGGGGRGAQRDHP